LPRLLTLLFAVVVAIGATRPRVGTVSFPNSGAAAAQPSFLLGLAQLHNFEYDAAALAFREAQRIDPGFAMAYWGEAMTRNHPIWMEQDFAGARRVLARLAPTAAQRLARAGTERERGYLQAVETLYGAGDKFERDRLYLEAMRRLHAAYPDDVDAAAFYALALLGSAHEGRDPAVYMRAAATLEEAFATHPDHPGVAHYLIHSYDDPVHAPLGLRAARRYSVVAPAAPHALHMTSHIYLAAGMWDEVVDANERATAVAAERARAAGRRPPGCGHANMWLLYGYLQQGRPGAARRILEACRGAATGDTGLELRSPEQDPLDPDNIPAGSYIQMWSRYLIDTGEFGDPLAREDIQLGALAGARVTRAFVRALAAAAANDASGLDAASAEMRDARQALDTTAAARPGADRVLARADVLGQELEALVLRNRGRLPDAIDLLRRAASGETAMPIEFGPPFVDKPAFELLGDMLLAADRTEDAISAYEAALVRSPKRTASLLGLARAAAKAGSPKAAAAFADLRQIWHGAEAVPDDVKGR
jgi:tetratricopeptide (TPR) repeat protein